MLYPSDYLRHRVGSRARFGVLVVVVSVFVIAEATAQEPSNQATRDLPETPVEYERAALKNSPELEAVYERWQAARSEADAAGSQWPQPRVGYRTFIDGWWLEDPRLRHRGTISQKFPWPGVLEESADPAKKRAEAMTHEFRARVLEVVFEVREVLIDIARLEARRDILEEQRAVYGDVVGIVEQTMETGDADYGDLLRVNTAREKIADRLDSLESARRQRVADLRELIAVDAGTELPFDFGDDGLLGVDGDLPDRQELVEEARTEHPSLAARRSRAEARVERAEYANQKRYPWPTLSLGVDSMPDRMRLSGYDRRTALMLHVSVPIPLFTSQYDNKQDQFQHQQDAVLAEREETALELTGRVEKSIERIDERRRRLSRYRDELLPLAGDATEHMLDKIETGERTVTDYLLSFEQELDLETNLVEFRATIATERARLERLTGGAFDAFPDRQTPDIEIRQLRDERDTHE